MTRRKMLEKLEEIKEAIAWALLDDAERWASECDGTYGHAGIEYETGRTTTYGSPETIRFDLVRPEIIAIENDDGERVGLWDTSTPWTFGENCDCAGTIEEAVYRFIG